MRTKKIGYLLSGLLLFSAFIFTVDALPDITASLRGGGVTIELTYPEEAQQNDTITHNIKINATNGAVTVNNFTLVIEAPVNSGLQEIYRSPQPFSFVLPENEGISMTPPPRFTLPQDANGTLYCFIFIQTNQTLDYASYKLYTTQVRNMTYSDLLGKYNALIEEYNVLNITYNQLLADFDDLNNTYNDLQSSYAALNSSYNELSGNYSILKNSYDDLLAQYKTLNNNYNELDSNYNSVNSARNSLLGDYGELQSVYDTLNSTFYSVQGNYTDLKTVHDALNQTYYDLVDEFATLQNRADSALNNDRIVMFIFVITLVALIAFIIYLKRGKEEPYVVIRKETVSMNQDEDS